MNIEQLAKKMKKDSTHNMDFVLYNKELYEKYNIGTLEEYNDIPCAEDIAYQYIQELKNVPLNTVRFTLLDSNYEKYLKENNLEDSSEVSTQYARQLSDEERQRIWESDELGYSVDWGIIPLGSFNGEEAEFHERLSKSARQKISKEIFKSFKNYNENGITYDIDSEKDIVVLPYIMNVSAFEYKEISDLYLDLAYRELFGEDVDAEYDKLDSSQIFIDNTTISILGIMVVYRYHVPSIISKEYFNDGQIKNIEMPDIDNEKICDYINKDLKNIECDVITTCIIYIESLSTVLEQFNEALGQYYEERMDTMDKFIQKELHTKQNSVTKKNKKRNMDF